MRTLFVVCCIAVMSLFTLLPVQAQNAVSNDSIGIMAFTGFGWSNNLRTEDWLNAHKDIARDNFNSGSEVEDEKATVIYGGFDFEPRYFLNNFVYAMSIGYHQTTTGERNVSGTQIATTTPLTFHTEASLSMISVKATVYYRVSLTDSSFVLLGGGLGYYRAKLEVEYGYNDNLESYEGTGWTIGCHTQLEYNRKLFGNLLLTGGVMSRFAEVWKLKINKSNGDEVYDSGASLSGIYFYVGAGLLI